ncbi:MAG: alpha/beta hydrolase [Planctomycetota bacterium]
MKRVLPIATSLILILLAAFAPGTNRPVTTHAYVDDPHDRQHLDVYPANADGPAPAILFVHGGGWSMGDKRRGRTIAPAFNASGITVVSIGYRLTPDIGWPENAQDVAAAVAWVVEHADELGVDPDRLTIMGHSAGAHLAACVGAMPEFLAAHELSPAILHGVVLLDGAGYDQTTPNTDARRIRQRNRLQLFGDDPANWKAGSPTLNVGEPGTIAPHWLSVLADGRRASAEQTSALFAALESAGASTTTRVGVGETHRTVLSSLADATDADAQAIVELVLTETPSEE